MIPIIPAIMPKSRQDITSHVQLLASEVSMFQLDIMDGVFVPPLTWPYQQPGQPMLDSLADMQNQGLPMYDLVHYEFDLMVARPEETLKYWLSLGPARVVIHLESVQDFDRLATVMNAYESIVQFGLSFDHQTPLDHVMTVIKDFDYVQIMGIAQIGYQGQQFSSHAIEAVRAIRKQYPDMIITVDGAVNMGTIAWLSDAGADQFVAGSALYGQANPKVALQDLHSQLL